MRDRIVVVAIILFDKDICNEIYKALCYSTHVKILIIKNKEHHFLYNYRCTVIDIEEGLDSDNIRNLKRLIEENNIELLYIASSKVSKEIILLADEVGINIANGSFFTNYDKKHKRNIINEIPDKYQIQHLDENYSFRYELKKIISAVTERATHYSQLGAVRAKKIVFDCFRDRHGKTILVSPICYLSDSLERIFRIGIEDATDLIINFVSILGDTFGFRGAWSFDINFNQSAVGFNNINEINFLPAHREWIFHRAKGINIPLLCVQDFLDRDIQIIQLIDSEHLIWSADMELFIDVEYSAIFVDLDETVIIEDKKVPIVINFLVSAKKDRKKIVLITRHKNNIVKTLAESSIDVGLFDKIIHVGDGEKKSDIIKIELEKVNGKIIFIDNEFPERRDVSSNCDIPVFDVNGIDFIQ